MLRPLLLSWTDSFCAVMVDALFFCPFSMLRVMQMKSYSSTSRMYHLRILITEFHIFIDIYQYYDMEETALFMIIKNCLSFNY